MKLFFLSLVAVILVSACTPTDTVIQMIPKSTLSISSPAFQNNQMMPRKFTCQGSDMNPPLQFSGIPNGTKSLVLIMDDPDAPMSTWDHWILWNIPADTAMIAEDSVPEGAAQGVNSWGNYSYGGPCPPSGTHRYMFKLSALDTRLGIDETSKKHELESAMQGHILAHAELIGLYRKT
jgi:Raf kinase inhibitor-like YbhB/YbcL family protein